MSSDKILCIKDLKGNAGNITFKKGEKYAYLYNRHNNKITLFTHDDWDLPLLLDLDENLDLLKNIFILPTIVKRINVVKNLIKKEFSDEYEAYMKLVTDNFIAMQSDNINKGRENNHMYYEVDWDGKNLEYQLKINPTHFIQGITLEDVKKHNATTAQSYLHIHSLTYEQWCIKFKKI